MYWDITENKYIVKCSNCGFRKKREIILSKCPNCGKYDNMKLLYSSYEI